MKLTSSFRVSFFLVGVFLLSVALPQQVLSATFQELWGTNVFTTDNGWTPDSVQSYFAADGYDLTVQEATDLIAAEDSGNVDASFAQLSNKFATAATAATATQPIIASVVGGTGTAAASYIAPAAATGRFIFASLVTPEPATLLKIKSADLGAAFKKGRSFGSTGRAQFMKFDNAEDGNLYGLNLSLTQDVDDMSYGGAFAYEYLDFDTVEVYQHNFVVYLQKRYSLSDKLTASATGHLNYIYSYVNFENAGERSVNTGGIGTAGSISYDNGTYIGTYGLSYAYNHDDTGFDEQSHLIKVGTVQGLRHGEKNVYDVSLVYNLDLTDYTNSSGTNDYYEAGARFHRDFSDTWSCTVGYKKVLGISGFDSDEFILGSNWRF